MSKRLKKIMSDGEQAAREGKNVKALDDYPMSEFDFSGRNAWLVGWRNGGGDIMTGEVKP